MAVEDHNVFFIADPTDVAWPHEPTTPLINLNVLEEDCTAEGWGMVPGSVKWLDPQRQFEESTIGSFAIDGDLQAAARDGRGVLEFRLAYSPTQTPTRTITEAARELARALRTPGVLAYKVKGEADLLYFDYVRSPSVALLRGQDLELFVIGYLQTEFEGVPVQVLCQKPSARLARQTLGPFTVNNHPDGRTVKITNPGDVAGELQIVAEPAAGDVVAMRYALRAHGTDAALDEYRTIHAKASALATPKSPDTAVAAVADSTGGDAMVIDFSDDESMVRRFRDIRTPVEPTTLEGVHMLVGRIRAVDGTNQTTKHRIKPRYGFSTADLVMEALRRVPFDWRDVNNPKYVEVELGKIKVPKGAPRLVLDIDAQRVTGDQSLAIEQLILEPADVHRGIVAVVGFRLGAWALSHYDPDDLQGTGELKRDAYRLNETGELARVGGAGGVKLPAGVHEWDVEAMLREPLEDDAELALFEVVRNPGGGEVVLGALPFRGIEDQTYTHRRRTIAHQVTQAQVDAGDKWQARLTFTRADANRRRVHVLEFEHRFIEAFTIDQPLVIDPWLRRAYGSDGTGTTELPKFSAIHENDPPLSPPGPQVWTFALGDRVVDPGYKDADERTPLARSELDREAEVTLILTPRRFGI